MNTSRSHGDALDGSSGDGADQPRVAFLFSGQGSHFRQMGQELYAYHPTFRRWMDQLDAQVRELTQLSVISSLYDTRYSRRDTFNRTLLSHPAIFMVEYALSRALIDDGVSPDVVIGASLGTFAAAAVAGCLTPGDALAAVVQHALAIEGTCEPGRMIAVLGPRGLFERLKLGDHGELAAVHFQSHFVVSSTLRGVESVEEILRANDIACERLPVSFAFHSRWIDTAAPTFSSYCRSLEFGCPSRPLIDCATSKTLDRLSGDSLWAATRAPIEFQRTIENVESEAGVVHYVDVGPSESLATFIKYLRPGTASQGRLHSVLSRFGGEQANFARILSRLGT